MPLPTLVALWNGLAEVTLGPHPRDSRPQILGLDGGAEESPSPSRSPSNGAAVSVHPSGASVYSCGFQGTEVQLKCWPHPTPPSSVKDSGEVGQVHDPLFTGEEPEAQRVK